jgi:hypothetical protein
MDHALCMGVLHGVGDPGEQGAPLTDR